MAVVSILALIVSVTRLVFALDVGCGDRILEFFRGFGIGFSLVCRLLSRAVCCSSASGVCVGILCLVMVDVGIGVFSVRRSCGGGVGLVLLPV